MNTFTLSTCKSVCLAATASLAIVALDSSVLETQPLTSRATQTAAISKTSGRAPADSSGSSSQLTAGGTSPGNPGVRSLAVAPTASKGTIVLGGGAGSGAGGGAGGGSGGGGSCNTSIPYGQVFINGGTFEMGRHWYEGDGQSDELPVHTVSLDSFLMDKFEVTNQTYSAYLNFGLFFGRIQMQQTWTGDYEIFPVGSMWDGGFVLCEINATPGLTYDGTWFKPTLGMENHPVVNVSWFGACAFANDLSFYSGLTPCYDMQTWDWPCDYQANGFRLPTEAEWEYAARGGQKDPYTRYSWYFPNDPFPSSWSGRYLNIWNSGDPYESNTPATTPVGYYDGNQTPSGVDMANGFGLYDMMGNVREWCSDWSDPYSSSPSSNPTGPTTGFSRVLRGGDWKEIPKPACFWLFPSRNAARASDDPFGCDTRTGFRLVSPPRFDEMAAIPAGTFEMGNHQGTGGGDEFPVHTVTLDAFWMDQFEVSCQKYATFLNSALANGDVIINLNGAVCQAANPTVILCDTKDSYHMSNILLISGEFVVASGMEDHPMGQVSWFGACAYANALSLQHGLNPCYNETDWSCDTQEEGFRLPTESEWEYAARGGEYLPYTIYPFGDTIDGNQANYIGSGHPFALSTPVGYYDGDQVISGMPVGADMANGFGLYDMSGNAMEWCGDRYGLYSGLPSSNPTGATTGSSRVLRGGSFYHGWNNLRSAEREQGAPTLRGILFGFRLVATACQ